MSKTIGDLQHEAVILNALLEGLDDLLHDGPIPQKKDSAYALTQVCKERARQLADELDSLESATRQRGAGR